MEVRLAKGLKHTGKYGEQLLFRMAVPHIAGAVALSERSALGGTRHEALELEYVTAIRILRLLNSLGVGDDSHHLVLQRLRLLEQSDVVIVAL